MTRSPSHQLLSKSRFLGGLQCLKRLYLEAHNPEIAEDIGEADEARLEQGKEIGRVAHKRFPGGVLVHPMEFGEAVEITRELIADPEIPSIYEGAFIHNGVRIRVDVLERVKGNAFNLNEVKSSSRVKPEHIPDVALQVHVAGSEMQIERVSLVHINTEYVYKGGDYDLNRLFTLNDVTQEAVGAQTSLPAQIATMQAVLKGSKPPSVPIGRHCDSPVQCPFWGHCHVGGPEFPVQELPRYGNRKKLKLRFEEMGIDDIRHIPQDMEELPPEWERIRDSVKSGRPYFDPALPQALKVLKYPIHFLDFETFNPALPMFPETRPYQVIPFQWSCHVLDEQGRLEHKEFLHDGADDPRPDFAASLLQALGTKGSIIVYNQAFEASRIRELAAFIPEKSQPLLALLDRFVDLLPIIKDHVYHPEFRGSYSIKSVLPALVPTMNYDGLSIGDGDTASAAYSELLNGGVSEQRRSELRQGLLKYCCQDTLAMLRIYYALQSPVTNS